MSEHPVYCLRRLPNSYAVGGRDYWVGVGEERERFTVRSGLMTSGNRMRVGDWGACGTQMNNVKKRMISLTRANGRVEEKGMGIREVTGRWWCTDPLRGDVQPHTHSHAHSHTLPPSTNTLSPALTHTQLLTPDSAGRSWHSVVKATHHLPRLPILRVASTPFHQLPISLAIIL